MTARIVVGDVREVLGRLPDGMAHTVVTSPPYFGLRDYKVAGQMGLEKTPDEYVAALVEVFRQVRRVLRDDGTLWLNLGDSYAAQGGSGAGGNAGRMGRAYQQRNVRPNGHYEGLKPKDLIGIPWRVAFALQADGWYLRQDIIWHKPNPMPESVRDRCTKAHEYIFMLSKQERYYYDSDSITEPCVTDPKENYPRRAKILGHGEQGAADARGNDRDKSGGFPPRKQDEGHRRYAGFNDRYFGQEEGPARRNRRSVWTVTTKPFKGAHFATFPPALIEPCILAGCPPGGTVLDPFFGAGTTGLVANQHGRHSLGIELNPDYAEIARRRIGGDTRVWTLPVKKEQAA